MVKNIINDLAEVLVDLEITESNQDILKELASIVIDLNLVE